MKLIKYKILTLLRSIFPTVYDYFYYRHNLKGIKNSEMKRYQQCVQIGYRDNKISNNWIVVDKYDFSPLVDLNDDVSDLSFPDDSIDIIVCNAILQYVVKPSQVIQEFNRVLKKGGKIWIEVPSIQPITYINKHVGFDDLWRFSLKGIEMIVADHFKTIQIGYSRVRNSYLNFGVYYYGEKI